MQVINAALLFCVTIYYSYTPIKDLSKIGFTFQSGMQLGVLYFIIIPLWVAVVADVLPVPIDFLGTLIPDLVWESDAEVIFYMLLPIAALPLYLVAFSPISVTQKRIEGARVHAGRSRPFLWTYLFLYVFIALAVYVLSGLSSGGHWYRTKEDFLLSYGLIGAFLQYSIVATRVLFLATVLSEWLRDTISLKVVVALIAAVCVLDLYTTGNRIFALQSALALAAAMMMRRRTKTLIMGFLMAIPFGMFMSLFRWIRSFLHDYSGSGMVDAVSGLSKGVQFATEQVIENGFGIVDFISSSTESVNVNVYSAIIKNFPSAHDYLYGESYLKMIVFVVPRSLWPNKPDSITAIVGSTLAPGTGVSLVATFFGECYANFGILTLFLAPILIVVANALVFKLFRRDTTAGIICFVSAFTLIRMAYSDVIVSVIVMALIAGCAHAGLGLLRSRHN